VVYQGNPWIHQKKNVSSVERNRLQNTGSELQREANVKSEAKVFWRPPANGKSGRWIARFCFDGKMRDQTVPRAVAACSRDGRAAQKWADEKAEELAKPAQVTLEPTIAEIADRFLRLMAESGRKAATLAEYESHCRLSIVPEFGEQRVESLDIPRLRKWVRQMSADHGRSTCSNRLSTLATMLDAARGEGWTKCDNNARDPAVREWLPLSRSSRPDVMRVDELAAVVACSKIPFLRRLRYLVGAYGVDDGCIAALRFRNCVLDEEVASIEIETAIAMHGPKGYATEQGPKTEHRRRVIPINADLAEALREWKASGWVIWAGAEPADDDFVFVNSRGLPWRPKSAKQFRKDLAAAGVSERSFDFKSLRKYFATQLAEAGANSEQRARLLGHRGPTTAARFYTAAVIRQDRELVKMLPRLACPPEAAWRLAGTSATNWSHLRDLNSRPTVYEMMGS
jgi:integrase